MADSRGWSQKAPELAQDQATARARPAGSSVAFGAVMVFMGILLLAPQALFPILAPLRIALLTAAIAIIAQVAGGFLSGQPVSFLSREIVLATGLFGWAVVTVPFSLWPGGSVEALTGLFVKSLMLFWLIASTITTMQRFRAFAWGLTLMSVPLAVTGIWNYLSGSFLPGSERITGYDAPLTSNPNDLALTLNLMIPFCLAIVRSSSGCLVRTVAVGVVVLNVIAVLVTFSRAGFVTLAIILAGTIVRLFRSRARAWGVGLVAVLLASMPLVPPSMWERWATITDIESDATGSAQARRTLNYVALDFVKSHPFVGAGIGQNILGLRELEAETWNEVHNVYLQYAMELGLPGLGLFLTLFWSCVRRASKGRLKAGLNHNTQVTLHLAQATRLSLIAFGVAAFFYPVAYHFYFYYLAGLAVAAGRMLDDGKEAAKQRAVS